MIEVLHVPPGRTASGVSLLLLDTPLASGVKVAGTVHLVTTMLQGAACLSPTVAAKIALFCHKYAYFRTEHFCPALEVWAAQIERIAHNYLLA